MSRNIWCLWEPPGTLPGYLRACLRTIERNSGAPVRLLTGNDVQDLAPQMRPDLAGRLENIAQRSDYYRSHLLAAQGGLWLDVDIVVLKDLTFVFDAVLTHDLVARQSVQGHVSNGFLGAPPQSPIVHEWIGRQTAVIEALARGAAPSWVQLGATTLTESLRSGSVHLIPTEKVAPVPWTQSHEFLSRFTSPEDALRADPATVMLYNAQFPTRLRGMSEGEVLRSPMMVSRLLRVALGESTRAVERRIVDPPGRLLETAGRKARGTARRLSVWNSQRRRISWGRRRERQRLRTPVERQG